MSFALIFELLHTTISKKKASPRSLPDGATAAANTGSLRSASRKHLWNVSFSSLSLQLPFSPIIVHLQRQKLKISVILTPKKTRV